MEDVRHGRIDGLVSNVGAAFRRAALDTALADLRQVLEVNLLATFALCCAAHPHQVESAADLRRTWADFCMPAT